MQNAQIIGNIVADAEARKGQDGNEFLIFRVAVNENRRDEKRTQYYDVYFQKTNVLQLLKKGVKVFVGGHISLSAAAKGDNVYINASISARDVEIISSQQG